MCKHTDTLHTFMIKLEILEGGVEVCELFDGAEIQRIAFWQGRELLAFVLPFLT